MKKILAALTLFVSLCSFSFPAFDDIKNYYGIPETLLFNNINYKLVASYHPNDIYYKQEYIPTGESADHYNTMLIIDFYITDQPAKKLLEIKENEMSSRKKTDPVVSFERFENEQIGEWLLDFRLSDSKGEKPNVVERNLFRYKNHVAKSGKKGILLFGVSQRAYGDGITSFLASVKASQINDINKLTQYVIPNININ